MTVIPLRLENLVYQMTSYIWYTKLRKGWYAKMAPAADDEEAGTMSEELLFGPHPEWPEDGQPAYQALAGLYRTLITTGAIPDGAKLPSQREMVERHKLSPITVKAALRQLAEEGLVRARKGSGQYARRPTKVERIRPTGYLNPDGRMTYAREAQAAGKEVQADHATTTEPATAAVADLLDIEEGQEVTATAYLVKMDGQPHSASTSYEPTAITGGTDIADPHAGPVGGSGLVNRFRHIGLAITEIEERLDIRQPTPPERDTLAIPAGVPVVEVTQIALAAPVQTTFYTDPELTPVEASVIVFPSDRVKFVYKMPLSSRP